VSGAIRRLNEPVPADVWLGDDGRPSRVTWRARTEPVECVLDTWYVDDAWWSERPLRRIYHEVQLETGVRLVLSWDLVAKRWLAQR
jgi:hypothetical protein